MPVYVYRNLTTDETFEVKQSITEAALKVHPETGDPVRRLIQPVGIAFKGSGFYVNDSKSSKNAASNSVKPDAASDTKSEATGDGKAEPAKAEPAKAADTKTESSKKSEPKAAKAD